MLDFEDFKREYQEVPVEEYPNNVLEAVPEPMVSVQISTYQHADFIRDCLEGVLMQETDFPVEILIGEDESDDGTREICKEYADRHPDKIRLFLHCRENNIKIHGRPTGKFQSTYTRFKCRGKYIAMCEGDDYWTDPEKLQKQVDFLEDHPEYVLSHHDAKVVDRSGSILSESRLSDEYQRDYSRDSLIKDKNALLLTLSVVYKNVVNEVPPESLQVINGDTFLFCMLGRYGRAKYQKSVEKSVYRVHDGGVWSKKDEITKIKHSVNTYAKMKSYIESTHETKGTKEIDKNIYLSYSRIIEEYKKRGEYSFCAFYLIKLTVFCVRNMKIRNATVTVIRNAKVLIS